MRFKVEFGGLGVSGLGLSFHLTRQSFALEFRLAGVGFQADWQIGDTRISALKLQGAGGQGQILGVAGFRDWCLLQGL